MGAACGDSRVAARLVRARRRGRVVAAVVNLRGIGDRVSREYITDDVIAARLEKVAETLEVLARQLRELALLLGPEQKP
jgi:hypothetical protein